MEESDGGEARKELIFINVLIDRLLWFPSRRVQNFDSLQGALY